IPDVRGEIYGHLDKVSLLAVALTCSEANRETAGGRRATLRPSDGWELVWGLLESRQDALTASIFSLSTLEAHALSIARVYAVACLGRLRLELDQWPPDFLSTDILAYHGYLDALKYVRKHG